MVTLKMGRRAFETMNYDAFLNVFFFLGLFQSNYVR